MNAAADFDMRTVLVADDDAEFRRFLRDVLELAGFVVEEARNGDEALLKLRTAPPSVLLMDFDLGVPPNGAQVVAMLRTLPDFAALPIIYVTGTPDAGLAGAQAVLYKPVDPWVLTDAVWGVLRGN